MKEIEMQKILAFGASNSRSSINQQLAKFTAHQLKNVEVTILDLNDFEMPIYGIDKEKESGIPEKAQNFIDLLESHDGMIISLAEHNGNYTVAFKNVQDWASRLKKKMWGGIPIFLLSTSPGGRGGANVMNVALQLMPRMGAEVVAHFSLPLFKDHFSEEGITNQELKLEFEKQLSLFEKLLSTVS